MDGSHQQWLGTQIARRCVRHLIEDMQTPGAEIGRCTDCQSPQRIRRITTILYRKPRLTAISVYLIGQSPGF